jgi:hypothetical protein
MNRYKDAPDEGYFWHKTNLAPLQPRDLSIDPLRAIIDPGRFAVVHLVISR